MSPLWSDWIEKIVECFDNHKEIKRFSKIISIEEIRENEHNLNIRRYADSSPPAENYDIRGILNGGIPTKEINNEYTQEILNGFDIETILTFKNNEYMTFKENIQEKSLIRKSLGNESNKLVTLFEKWWDKYAISLNNINKEIEESENILKKYLEDLGYEHWI